MRRSGGGSYRRSMSIDLMVIVCMICVCCKWTAASEKPNRYLAHLFYKYGTHEGITFEGLEHLMFNLGIGDLEFNPDHTIETHRPDGFKSPQLTENVGNETKAFAKNLTSNENDERAQPSIEQRSEPMDTETYNKYDEGILGESEQDVSFISLHDPKHRHPRQHDHGILTTKACLSPLALLRRVLIKQQSQDNPNVHGLKRRSVADTENDSAQDNEEIASNILITPSAFLNLCPALLVQIDEGGCRDVVRVEMGRLEKGFNVAWIYATTSILIISMCGLIGIALVPLMKTIAYKHILRFLVAVAVGTLCGDALMHLLPHALGPSHDSGGGNGKGNSESESVWICSCAFFSALLMYAIENLLPLLRSGGGQHHVHSHVHSHSHHGPTINDHAINNQVKPAPTEETEIAMEVSKYVDEREQKILADSKVISSKRSLSPVAFMVIIGDGLHNLTDGMAIGAAFAVDPVTGMATALAVLCHELPHELGDFALLIQSGVSIRKAMFFNIVSSVLGVIGMVIGLVLVGINNSSVRWIYAATAGTFLYIGLADLVPEMGRTGGTNVKNVMLQFMGVLSGGLIMLLIGLYEDNLRSLFE